MFFFDYFRNFFGIRRRNEPSTSGLDTYDSHRESFRNPIWQSNDDDDDDDIDNFWHPRSSLHFNIFSDPLEITLYFESQIDNILKNFLKFNSTFLDDKAITALPFTAPEKDDNLRDNVLKPDTFAIADMPFENKVDTDLDGRISAREFSKMWNKRDVEVAKPSVASSFSIGRSIRKKIIHRPDGTIEKKQIIRDSEGNEETIISKEADGKTYVVTVKKDRNGIETKTENLMNMDESELKNFTQKWESSLKNNTNDGHMDDGNDGHGSILNYFPWEKFFGSNPKL
ncbi:uncharacterized protein LOC105834259 isoform X2 [Monomorium pharaonis]|uniref:uncharacterized protein LOC105834259 isoform X2 n=1 Tax=Monomorium pharaonis TaxID=307658 RepID=UPI0017468DDE|nr:uncharacterized protein LOC105834259 isoform X2 [Monomorium pharaonis]